MDFNKHFLIVIFFIFMFFNKPTKTCDEEELENLIALFDRPLEPLVRTKANIHFVLPDSYIDDKYQNAIPFDQPLLGSGEANVSIPSVIVIKEIPIPVLDEILSLDRREDFSVFIPKHRDIASKLIDLFLDAVDRSELLSLAAYVYGKVNPYLFVYAYSAALMHRPDTEGYQIPNQIQMFPDKYFDKQIFFQARAEVALVQPQRREPIDIPFEYTASDLDVEHRLTYWREDIALNLHHWHWHLAYINTGNKLLVKKDRRGELFYYMHQQVLARYNYERLSNHLQFVERLSNWYAPIREAYFPKLDSVVAKKIYPSRPKNMVLDDIKIPTQNVEIDVADIILMRDRILGAIDLGYAEDVNGEKIKLDSVTGIDILGNIIESSDLSPNPRYYGNLHGSGHLLLGYIHDPKHHHLEPMGIMGDTATAMRDPVFYRWHSYIDNIFRQFKETLPPYTIEELDHPGIIVSNVTVRTEREEYENVFQTFWNKTAVNLNNGLDFADRSGPVFVRYSHLDHRNFHYEITVENEYEDIIEGTCRIFLAPSGDETGKPWKNFRDQKNMFIQLDKFKVTLWPGQNNIIRESVNSAVTIPFDVTFYDFEKKSQVEKHVFTGCGWAHHLLIPKGVVHGLSSQLFVMISNFDGDQVENTRTSHNECYCGVRGKRYPDKRAMGYPSDRLPRPGVSTLKQFLTPNMFVQECEIIHDDEVI